MHRRGLRRVVLVLIAIGMGGGVWTTPSALHPMAPPVLKPELFGAGLFSTGAWDFFLSFSPNGRSALFCRADSAFSTFEILETRLVGGRWTAPGRPRFASRWSNADPHIALGGRTVYFISNRPLPGDTAVVARRTYDIWFATRGMDGTWGDARHLETDANDPRVTEWSPSVAANGNLYFGSARRGGRGGNDLWVSRLVNGAYRAPENLGDSINSQGAEIEPWIAPDESYLIFSGAARDDSVGGYDLFLSERHNGVWQKARLLPPEINSSALDFNQTVSPDGRWLYFSSTRPFDGVIQERYDTPRSDAVLVGIGNGRGDIYRIPMTAVRPATMR